MNSNVIATWAHNDTVPTCTGGCVLIAQAVRVVFLYGPGRDGAEVVFITIEGLGHIWAGGVNLLPEFIVGKPTDKFKATDSIWDFFKAHPAP